MSAPVSHGRCWVAVSSFRGDPALGGQIGAGAAGLGGLVSQASKSFRATSRKRQSFFSLDLRAAALGCGPHFHAGGVVALDWTWLAAMFLGASALRERSPHTISAPPVHGCVALPRLPSISTKEPEKAKEIEVKTVSENRVRAPEIDPNTAIDQCIVEMIEAEPGCEFRFAEILRHYTIQANSRWKSGWPREVSTVALSRRLKDAGAVRFQKRYSDRDKPIYYRLPETVPEHLKAWRKLQ